jgi:hypothetical protein
MEAWTGTVLALSDRKPGAAAMVKIVAAKTRAARMAPRKLRISFSFEIFFSEDLSGAGAWRAAGQGQQPALPGVRRSKRAPCPAGRSCGNGVSV